MTLHTPLLSGSQILSAVEQIDAIVASLKISGRPSEAMICLLNAAERAVWGRAAQLTLSLLLELKNPAAVYALPMLIQARQDRWMFHEFNVDEYHRQINRWCAESTLDQFKKAVYLYSQLASPDGASAAVGSRLQ